MCSCCMLCKVAQQPPRADDQRWSNTIAVRDVAACPRGLLLNVLLPSLPSHQQAS